MNLLLSTPYCGFPSVSEQLWYRFTSQHRPDEVADVLKIIKLRGVSQSEFVRAYMQTGHLQSAIHLVWRAPRNDREQARMKGSWLISSILTHTTHD